MREKKEEKDPDAVTPCSRMPQRVWTNNMKKPRPRSEYEGKATKQASDHDGQAVAGAKVDGQGTSALAVSLGVEAAILGAAAGGRRRGAGNGRAGGGRDVVALGALRTAGVLGAAVAGALVVAARAIGHALVVVLGALEVGNRQTVLADVGRGAVGANARVVEGVLVQER